MYFEKLLSFQQKLGYSQVLNWLSFYNSHLKRLYSFLYNLRILVILLGTPLCLLAQDMEPRAYSNAPIGTNFLGSGFTNSSGGVSLDPSAPVTDVEADINITTLGISRFFSLQNRLANASIILPRVDADLSGNIGEEKRSINRTGLGDLRFRLAMNLIGSEPKTPEEFTKYSQKTTTVGISSVIVAPTGEYNPEYLINIGTNRWAFKPEIGVSHSINNWFMEGTYGLWLYTDNDNFYGGKEREQKPINSFQLHTGYTFSPGLWLSADATYWSGGQTKVEGVEKNDTQSSSRYGLTLSVPLSKKFSIKLACSKGLSARIGNDFTTYTAALQYLWFDPVSEITANKVP